MEATEAIADSIRTYWPKLDIQIEIHLKKESININRPLPAQNAKIWIANIDLVGDTIKLFCSHSDQPSYQNTLNNPISLDEVLTILATHIQDVDSLHVYHTTRIQNGPSIKRCT